MGLGNRIGYGLGIVLVQFAILSFASSSFSGKFHRLPVLSEHLSASGGSTSLTIFKHSPTYHAWSTEKCLESFEVAESLGLSSSVATDRLGVYGRNELIGSTKKTLIRSILEQFEDGLVQVLLGVATASAIVAACGDNSHDFVEPAIIGAILLLNAVVSALQSRSAQDALASLQQLQPSFAAVLRDGVWRELPVTEVVPGDIVSLRTGDKVPADGRVLNSKTGTIRVDESSLTGESNTVFKDSATVQRPLSSPVEPEQTGDDITDKTNMVFSGTMVTQGSCIYLVTQTGNEAEIGKINAGIVSAKQTPTKTPLTQSLESFSGELYKIVAAICLSVWVVNIPRFGASVFSSWSAGAIHYAKVAVALGVAAIPEGLPAIITLSLALGTSKMAKRNVIVRKLSSVETLGCTSVICTDKTGTLTTNQMTVKKLVTVKKMERSDSVRSDSREEYGIVERNVKGDSYNPNILNAIDNFQWSNGNADFFHDFTATCALCNNAELSYDTEKNAFIHIGEPTEASLKVLAQKMGVGRKGELEMNDDEVVEEVGGSNISKQQNYNEYWRRRYTFLHELEFSRDRKLMSVLFRENKLQKNRIFTKGAAEVVLQRCNRVKLENGRVVTLTPGLREQLARSFEVLAQRSYRCLGLALKEASEISSALDGITCPGEVTGVDLLQSPQRFLTMESDMVFVGLCGIVDPPRPEINAAIRTCQDAGVRVIMITGDSEETACAIAGDVGIFSPHDTAETVIASSSSQQRRHAFSGKEFFRLPEEQQYKILQHPSNLVICRAEPQDKQRLIRMLADCGEVTAMTGDGVNDAPALQQADIGIAMGITGTEVSKNAADMILADDNFSSIVSAIEEGRGIYDNMQSFIFFLISSNVGEVMSVFVAAMLGLPDVFTPVHLLWVNLVTDGPPATALGFNPPQADVMQRSPRPRDTTLFSTSLVVRLLVSGAYVALATIGSFLWWFLDKGVGVRDVMTWEKCGSSGAGAVCNLLPKSLAQPQTMALTVLVLMEMLKALSAISLDASLLRLPPWKNPMLIVGTILPMLLHAMFMYVPVLSSVLGMHSLSLREWKVIVAFALPILVVEEVSKYFSRRLASNHTKVKNMTTL